VNVLRPHAAPLIVLPPENATRLRAYARKALERVDAYGVLPTPLEDIMEDQRLRLVIDSEEERASFLSGLSGRVQQAAKAALNKLRGVLDTRERKVWVRERPGKPRLSRFPTAHEVAHDLLPWHRVRAEYVDDRETLAPEVRTLMEREANYTGAQLLFQGEVFRDRVMSEKESLHSALALADEHETTFHSTLWEYVEAQDRLVAVAVYRKLHVVGAGGGPLYEQREVYAANRFAARFSDVELPVRLNSSDPWVEGVIGGEEISSGTCRLRCGGAEHGFTWEAWTNTYSLFVLIRREPKVAPVTGLIRRLARRAA
jgi:hypothetical protein